MIKRIFIATFIVTLLLLFGGDVYAKASSDFQAYEIDLQEDVQQYLFQKCQERNLDFETMLAFIYVESTFQSDLISSTNDYGLMQINRQNHNWLKQDLGITNFLDPYENINAGTYILSSYFDLYDQNLHKAAMAYNMGQPRMKQLWSQGTYSSRYSRKIEEKLEEIKNTPYKNVINTRFSVSENRLK